MEGGLWECDTGEVTGEGSAESPQRMSTLEMPAVQLEIVYIIEK